MSILQSTEDLGHALTRLRQSMPKHVQDQWAAEDQKREDLIESVKSNCVEALECIACAMRYPQISLRDLDEAIASLTAAREAAKELDK